MMKESRRDYGRFIAVLIVCLLLGVSFGAGYLSTEGAGSTSGIRPAETSFEVHYIDVGQADAILVRCDGRSMMIDGGNAADSSRIYSYLKNRDISYLDYIVCTHAHEDHAGGLAGALNYATVGVAYAPVTESSCKEFMNFVEYLSRQNVSVTVPAAGDSFSLGSSTVSVLGPVQPASDPNNTSIVLRIEYGDTSFLFTGDAEREEEQDMLDTGVPLSSTVLKVGHHGADTSTGYPFLNKVRPIFAVISVGASNVYGHPSDNTLSRLRDADVRVYRTDLQGTIVCTSDGTDVCFTVERNADADTLASVGTDGVQSGKSSDGTAAASDPVHTDEVSAIQPECDAICTYILNTNTHKFHLPDCAGVSQIKAKNKETYIGTRNEVLSQGYTPCKACNP